MRVGGRRKRGGGRSRGLLRGWRGSWARGAVVSILGWLLAIPLLVYPINKTHREGIASPGLDRGSSTLCHLQRTRDRSIVLVDLYLISTSFSCLFSCEDSHPPVDPKGDWSSSGAVQDDKVSLIKFPIGIVIPGIWIYQMSVPGMYTYSNIW